MNITELNILKCIVYLLITPTPLNIGFIVVGNSQNMYNQIKQV